MKLKQSLDYIIVYCMRAILLLFKFIHDEFKERR